MRKLPPKWAIKALARERAGKLGEKIALHCVKAINDNGIVEVHSAALAEKFGCTPERAEEVLDMLFGADMVVPVDEEHDDA